MAFKVLTIVGTRPELIKLSKIIPELDKAVDHILVHTGQNELLLNDHRKYDRMAQEMNPCGDGKTSEKILSPIKSYFFDPVLDSK